MRDGWAQAQDAVGEGLAFAPRAWRDAWAPLAVSAAGQAAMFVADRLDAPAEAAGALRAAGFALLVLMFAPKLGALHRGALDLQPPATASPRGLRLGRTELRLAATAVALAGLAAIVLAAALAAALVLLTLLRPLGVVRIGGATLGLGFLLLLPGVLAMAAAGLGAMGRLAVTLPADAAEPSPRFARGWELTRTRGLACGLVLLATGVLPAALVVVAPVLLDRLPTGAGLFDRTRSWPLGEAMLAGAALALLTQFVFAPMNAGGLAHLYRTGRAREGAREEAGAGSPAQTTDGAAAAARDTPRPLAQDPLAT